MKLFSSTHITALFATLLCLATGRAETTVMSFDGSSGLTNGLTTSIAQDGRGYVWIATEDGLNRFDGQRFKGYTRTNSGLTANEFNSIAYSSQYPDSLWIATQRDGMCVFDHKTGLISKLDIEDLSNEVTSITPASGGGLWLSNYHYGLQLLDPLTGEIKTYDHSTINGLPNGSWCVTEGKNGELFIGHTKNGFSVVDTLSHSFTNFDKSNGLPGNSVFTITADRSGNIWIGTDHGAALFNPSTATITPFVHDEGNANSIGAGRVRGICALDNGEIWFATDQGGVSILDTRSYVYADISHAKFTSMPVNGMREGTSSANIRCITQDSFGNIWIGNYRSGVNLVSHIEPLFAQLDYITQTPGPFIYKPVWSCFADKDGTLWLGGDSEIVKVDGNRFTSVELPSTGVNIRPIVKSLLKDKAGRLWIGTSECGAMTLDKNRQLTRLTMPAHDVRSFFEEEDGTMLIGTQSGLFRSDGHTTIPVEEVNASLVDRIITGIVRDRKGRLWVGTFGKGITVFAPDMSVIAHHSVANEFPSNAINALKFDSSQRLWVATRNGVAIFNRDDIDKFMTVPELTSRNLTHIKAIEEDRFNDIWLSSTKGILKLDGKTMNLTLYEDPQDFPFNSFHENASMVDTTGTVYFASGCGVFSINPGSLAAPIPSKPVVVTDFTVYETDETGNQKDISLNVASGEVMLKPEYNTFTITFNILDPATGLRTDIAYRLKGLGDVWIEAQGGNTAMFRNIPAGNYEFQVRQRLKGKEWSEPETILAISVKPQLWLTWWAKMIYILAAAGILVRIMLYYKHRVDLKQRLDSEIENNRNRQNLNEERLRFYTNITHELRTPLTLIMGPLEDLVSDPGIPSKYAFKLQTIRDSSMTLLNLINGILDFRKTETQNRRLIVKQGNLGNLVREIGLRYKELNRNPDVEFRIDIDPTMSPMWFDSDMLTTILNNLLSNAVKYTPKGSITLTCRNESHDGINRTVISVADTGYGISKEGLEHIFERYYQVRGEHQASGTGIGLALVKSLADIHQAEISVDSRQGAGTVFSISLLTDNIYPDALHGTEENKKTDEHDNGAEEAPESPGRLKILVVEDNDDIREYIMQALSDEFDTIDARNGIEGLNMVQEHHPDIIVSDIMMPEMDGITMCRTIKENIMSSHIPIILLTAKDSLPDREEGYDAGADSYLTKPFSAKLLRSRIYSILRIRRQVAAHFMSNTAPQSPAEQPRAETPAETHKEVENGLSELDRRFMDNIIAIINENISREDLSVPFIADKMCMSSSTLYRKINAILGVSTNEYIRHIRLSRAAEMLIGGDKSLTITDIAEQCGFGSHSSFAKAFKKAYGMTATEYATRHGSSIKD